MERKSCRILHAGVSSWPNCVAVVLNPYQLNRQALKIIMKWSLASLALSATSVLAAVVAQPPIPGLVWLYSCNATVSPRVSLGITPVGERFMIPITGGEFYGPRMNGTILNLGADWGLTDNKGIFNPDTRYNLRTSDGALIYIQTAGPTTEDGRSHLRAIYQTGSEQYYWLNYVVAVGVLTRVRIPGQEGYTVQIDMWQASVIQNP
jgi:feruloyl esterase